MILAVKANHLSMDRCEGSLISLTLHHDRQSGI
jgi:hypothetical protein